MREIWHLWLTEPDAVSQWVVVIMGQGRDNVRSRACNCSAAALTRQELNAKHALRKQIRQNGNTAWRLFTRSRGLGINCCTWNVCVVSSQVSSIYDECSSGRLKGTDCVESRHELIHARGSSEAQIPVEYAGWTVHIQQTPPSTSPQYFVQEATSFSIAANQSLSWQ